MSAILARLTPGELFWLASMISHAEGYACGRYMESGDTAHRELFAELLSIRLDAENAYWRVTSAVAQAHASRVSALMAVRLRSAAAPTPATHRDDTGGGEDR